MCVFAASQVHSILESVNVLEFNLKALMKQLGATSFVCQLSSACAMPDAGP